MVDLDLISYTLFELNVGRIPNRHTNYSSLINICIRYNMQ